MRSTSMILEKAYFLISISTSWSVQSSSLDTNPVCIYALCSAICSFVIVRCSTTLKIITYSFEEATRILRFTDIRKLHCLWWWIQGIFNNVYEIYATENVSVFRFFFQSSFIFSFFHFFSFSLDTFFITCFISFLFHFFSIFPFLLNFRIFQIFPVLLFFYDIQSVTSSC